MQARGERAGRRTLVIACGALAREILAVRAANGWTHLDVTCLPAIWHNRPEKIAPGVRRKIRAARGRYDEILVPLRRLRHRGELDKVLARRGRRAHRGRALLRLLRRASMLSAAMHEAEIGTLYLTDFLVRHFERFIIRGLGIDRHPELMPLYFGNYTRVVYLAQLPDARLRKQAEAAAARLSLPLVTVETGLGAIERLPREGRSPIEASSYLQALEIASSASDRPASE